ncbi:hypothetical protein J2P12_00500 [Candidatus Bathyarchaeota archaeon]|nr:hypothetical protein [Candidatus Bathyarchaeota archaeon]
MSKNNPYRKEEEASLEYEMDVYIDEMDEASGVGGGVANFLTGYTVYKNEKFRFEAVAYGRIGGQNVKPTLTDESVRRLEELQVDLELFTARLQRKLVEGEMTVNLPEGAVPPE